MEIIFSILLINLFRILLYPLHFIIKFEIADKRGLKQNNKQLEFDGARNTLHYYKL